MTFNPGAFCYALEFDEELALEVEEFIEVGEE